MAKNSISAGDVLQPTVIGPLIRELRIKNGWTEIDLAHLSDVDASMILKVESGVGDIGILTILSVARAAKIFNPEVALDELGADFVLALGEDVERSEILFDELIGEYARIIEHRMIEPSAFKRPKGSMFFYLMISDLLKLSYFELIPLGSCLEERYRGILLSTILPVDLGNLVKQCIKECAQREKKRAIDLLPNGEQVFWNHVAARRSTNVSASRLESSFHAIEPILEENEVSLADFKTIIVCAFSNYLAIEELLQRGRPSTPTIKQIDTTRLITHFLTIRRFTEIQKIAIEKRKHKFLK